MVKNFQLCPPIGSILKSKAENYPHPVTMISITKLLTKGSSRACFGAVRCIQTVPTISILTTKPGDGKGSPKRGQTVEVHYVGKLAGTTKVFDSSRSRGTPFSFNVGVGQVIAGKLNTRLQIHLCQSTI